jgi:hypothetical protein
MDSGVLIPPEDPVRLPAFVLKRLDLNPLYEAYSAYREKRRSATPGNWPWRMRRKGRIRGRTGGLRKRRTGGRPGI